jgi:nucleoid-associated protein YgaU
MTERSAPEAGAVACPFVAFVDDREARADVPDHRHRCYAEILPAPRALAHQQAFCLSAGFAACPTFQDWARREAARAAAPGQRPAARSAEAPADGLSDHPLAAVDDASGELGVDPYDPYDADARRDHDPRLVPSEGPDARNELEDDRFDDRASRNPHRDWAAPPPWVDPGDAPDGPEPDAPGFLTSRPGAHSDPGDLAPSPAGLSASRWLQDVPPPRTPDGPGPPERLDDDELERALAEDRANRERAGVRAGSGVAATGSSVRAARRAAAQAGPPPKVSAARRGPVTAGPSWERPRRFEAYPTLKTRLGLPAIPRLGVAALAVLVAAIVLFSLPFILGRGGGGGAVVTPSPSAETSAAAPSEQPAASPQTYIIKSGDTLLKIAKKFGLTVDELLAANQQIKNPNKIAVGDELIIPVAAPSDGIDGASSAPESAAP